MRHELSNPISGWMLGISLPLAVLLCQNSAMAQSPSTAVEKAPDAATVKEGEAKKKEKKEERIEVVGSRLKRVDVETAAPVVIVQKEEIEQSGAANVGDFFRKSAATSPSGNFAGGSGYVSSGAATIDLLGIGAARTLVLMNGRRIPSLPGLGAVNVDSIPTGVIERIEVLAGGASAVYGADAVGGVVNIITKKEFRGSEVSLFANVPQEAGGTERSATATTGLSFGDDTNLILSIGGSQRDPIDKRKRDLSFANNPAYLYNSTMTPLGSYSYRPLNSLKDRGDVLPSANCPVEYQQTINPSFPKDIYCAGLRSTRPQELMPKKDEYFGSIILNSDLSSDWNLNGILTYTDSKTTSTNSRANYTSTDPVTNASVYLSADKARSLGMTVGPDYAYVQLYAPVAESLDRFQDNNYKNSIAAAKLEGEILGGWRLQSGLSYTSSQVERTGRKYRNSEALHNLYFNEANNGLNLVVKGADPQFIPIDPERNSAAFGSIFADLKAEEFSDNTTWDAFIDRQLFELPGGPVAFSIGAQVTQETFKQTPDTRDIGVNSANLALYAGTYSNRGEGERTSRAIASEFAAPVTKFWDLEGALRLDNFSDFGDAVNYGLGTKVKVVQGVALRTRYATSFKAPNLDYLHQEGGGGYFNLNDDRWCEVEISYGRPCPTPLHQVYTDSVGNKDLDPEEGSNYSAGIILEPIQGLTLVSDYHAISLKKTFGNDDLQSILDTWYETTGNGADRAGGKVGVNDVRVNSDGVITSLGVPTRNMGRTEVRAVISEANYTQPVGRFRFNVGTEYSRMLSYKEADNDQVPLRQKIGYIGVPRWRSNNQLSVALDDSSLILTGRSIARQSMDPELASSINLKSKLSPYTEFDAAVATTIASTRLQLGVNNLLNTIGGIYDGNVQRSEDVGTQSLYSYVGRSYFARVTQSF